VFDQVAEHVTYFTKNSPAKKNQNIKSACTVRRYPRATRSAVGLTGPSKIGYIAVVYGEATEKVSPVLVRAGSFNRASCLQKRPVARSPSRNDHANNNAATLSEKCSVSRMARPQRGTYRFTEEPAPAISIECSATSSIPRLASCHPDRSSFRDPRVAVSSCGEKDG